MLLLELFLELCVMFLQIESWIEKMLKLADYHLLNTICLWNEPLVPKDFLDIQEVTNPFRIYI